MEGQELAARHIALRERAGLTQEQEAKAAGVSPTTISGIESGKITRPHLKTLLKIARGLGVDVGELRESGKAEAPTSLQPPLNGFEEERRPEWEAAVEETRRLREAGQPRMEELLAAWRASKKHGEPYDTRRSYLKEMGDLLQEVYDADVALGLAYVKASNEEKGGSESETARYLRAEARTMGHFYVELWRLVQRAGLCIRTEAGEASGAVVPAKDRPSGITEDKAA